MTQPTIGFIGLGLMGSAMVERLQNKGYHVTVMANRSRANVDAAIKRGASEVTSARELAQCSDIIMLCMDNSNSVESRMRGADGIMAGLKENAVVVDFGTSLPNSTRLLAKEVLQAGGHYLDAPLGRTPQHARDGLLNIMTAGNQTIFEQIKPVLADLGENVFYLGESGAGHTIKLLNNFFAMTTASAMSEIFAITDIVGVSRQAAYDVMSLGPAHSAIMDFIKTYAIDGNPEKMAFSIKNAAKDVNYYNQMAENAGVSSTIAPASLATLKAAEGEGYGENLVPEMVDFYQSKFAKKLIE